MSHSPSSPTNSSPQTLSVTSHAIRSSSLPFNTLTHERTTLWDSLSLENNRLRHQIKLLQEKIMRLEQKEEEIARKTWHMETQTEIQSRDVAIQSRKVKQRNTRIQTDAIDTEPRLPADFQRRSLDTENLILEPNDTILLYAAACFTKFWVDQAPEKADQIDTMVLEYLSELENTKKKKQMRQDIRAKLRDYICDSHDDFYFLKHVMQKKGETLQQEKRRRGAHLFDQVIGVSQYEALSASHPVGIGLRGVQSCQSVKTSNKSFLSPRSRYEGQIPVRGVVFEPLVALEERSRLRPVRRPSR